MLYFKRNVPGWERAVRLVLAAGAGYAASTALVGGWMQWAAWVVAGILALTAVVGYCPAKSLFPSKDRDSYP